MVHQGTLHQSTGPHSVHRGDRLTGQPVKHLAENGEVYMNFETAMGFSVVITNAESNTETILRVMFLEEELLDVPEHEGVPMEVDTNNYSNRTLACVSYVNSAGSSVPRRFCVHSAWSLRSDGREHGGRGFQAGRTRLSTTRMANFRGIGTGEYQMRRPTTSKLLLADSRVPILCHCRDCSRPSPDDFRPLSRRKSPWSLALCFLTS